MARKKVEVPVDTFKVFLRFPKNITYMRIKNVIENVANRKDKKILFLPYDVEVLVVNNKGQTKVL